ncbi:peptidoglycan-binding protein [Streptomyces sp. NBC_00335]|uniref:peptidoglycan-binding domain-containing protein n=1 Tax=unclassified Streptomyces TaxID=2593676 RepID=UPI002251E3EC|nr:MULTISPECIES: peptidoglycan-binding protein [unclassified Streptomyces]MCX5407550.1 peptidoglycan-binding protein [Streptomyces sp. NBC_00086]
MPSYPGPAYTLVPDRAGATSPYPGPESTGATPRPADTATPHAHPAGTTTRPDAPIPAANPGQAAGLPPHPGPAGTPSPYAGSADTPAQPTSPTRTTPLPPEAETPAYGTPVASLPDETMQLRAIPAYEPYATPGPGAHTSHGSQGTPTWEQAGPAHGYGAHGMAGADGPHDSGPPRRRIRALPITAAAAAVIGVAVLVLRAFSGSGAPETTFLDAKPSSPLISLTQVAPSQPAKSTGPPPSTTPSPSRSASPSASASASPSRTPSRSTTPSAAPSPTPSPTPSRSSAPTSRPPSAPTLRYGDSGPEVEKLQRLLAAQGIYRGKYDGKYGVRTESAVSTFQAYNDIDEDPWGVYGPATRRALEG